MIEILLDEEGMEEGFKVIKTDNYSQYDWINFRHVTLCRCLIEISPQDLLKSRETLQHITFKSMLLFKNVLTVLKNCPNIRSLRFSNAAVDEYKYKDWLEETDQSDDDPDPDDDDDDDDEEPGPGPAKRSKESEKADDADDNTDRPTKKCSSESGESEPRRKNQKQSAKQIFLPLVEHLEIEGSPTLTNDDYFLLDFFTRNVTFGNIESFVFRGKFFGVHRRHNLVSHRYSQIPCDLTIANFLIKNRDSLKRVEILGSGAKMKLPRINYNLSSNNNNKKSNKTTNLVTESPPSSSSSSSTSSSSPAVQTKIPKIHQKLATVQIQCLIFSFNPGMSHLLNNQQHLEELDICNYNDRLTIENFSEIFSCVRRNSETLTKISICPTIINEISENMTVDCQIFQDCHSLHTLRIWLSFLNHDNSWRVTPTLGKVKNIHKTPISLNHLRIDAESFDQWELNQLAERFPLFQNLQYLFLESSVGNHFYIDLTWVVKLMSLPKISFVDLTHCRSENDMDAIIAYMNTKIPPGYFFFLLDMFFYHKHISEPDEEEEEPEEYAEPDDERPPGVDGGEEDDDDDDYEDARENEEDDDDDDNTS